jgi:hypothetical protein
VPARPSPQLFLTLAAQKRVITRPRPTPDQVPVRCECVAPPEQYDGIGSSGCGRLGCSFSEAGS